MKINGLFDKQILGLDTLWGQFLYFLTLKLRTIKARGNKLHTELLFHFKGKAFKNAIYFKC